MAATKVFYDAVNDNSIRKIRIMMKDSLLVDPSFKEFNEMKKISIGVVGLYDEHDNRPFELDESNWNDDYMNKQMVQVVNNFSHERIEHLKDIVRYLRPITNTVNAGTHVDTKKTIEMKKDMSYEEQKHYDQINGMYRGAKIATGAVAGAVVGGVVASAAGVTVVGGAVTGAVLGGAMVTVITNGETKI